MSLSLGYTLCINSICYSTSMQEDSEKAGKVTSAGMYFLHFQVYRMDSTVNAVYKLH